MPHTFFVGDHKQMFPLPDHAATAAAEPWPQALSLSSLPLSMPGLPPLIQSPLVLPQGFGIPYVQGNYFANLALPSMSFGGASLGMDFTAPASTSSLLSLVPMHMQLHGIPPALGFSPVATSHLSEYPIPDMASLPAYASPSGPVMVGTPVQGSLLINGFSWYKLAPLAAMFSPLVTSSALAALAPGIPGMTAVLQYLRGTAFSHPSASVAPAHAPLPGPPGSTAPPQPPLLRAFYGLPEDKVIFCNFNQLYKIDPEQFDSWIRILLRAPNAVLWLLRFPSAGETNLRKYAEARGVLPEQIVFTNVAGKIEHVRRGSLADVFLDTTACNGHTTGMDILWGGTPIITLPGDTFASRVASSLLTALGCPELIATSREHYEDMAVDLALDAEKRRQMQDKVRQQRSSSPLFDARRLAANLERAFRLMVRTHELHGAPQHIVVSEESA